MENNVKIQEQGYYKEFLLFTRMRLFLTFCLICFIIYWYNVDVENISIGSQVKICLPIVNHLRKTCIRHGACISSTSVCISYEQEHSVSPHIQLSAWVHLTSMKYFYLIWHPYFSFFSKSKMFSIKRVFSFSTESSLRSCNKFSCHDS